MNQTMKYTRMTMASGILTLVAMGFSFLALTDIAHAQKDLTLEWGTLKVAALIILMFVALTFVTLRRVVVELRRSRTA